MTHFEFRWSGAEIAPASRQRIEQLLRVRLAHLGSRVTSARVFVSPASQSVGSNELRIVLRMPRSGDLVVTGRRDDLRILITETAKRASRAVLRSVERRRARRRRAGRTQHYTSAA